MAREIEFLAGPGPDDHGHPDEPAPPAPARRRMRLLAWGVAVAVIAAAAVWVATRPGERRDPSGQGGATRTVTATPGPRTTSPSITMRTCTAGQPLNKQFLLIARRNLPGMTLLADQSFRCTTGYGARLRVASESLAVRYRSTIIEIQASRRVGDDGQYQPAPQQRGYVLLAGTESQSAGLNVIVQVFGRPHTRVAGVALDRLASDVSLQLVL